MAGYRQQQYFPTIDIYSVLKTAKCSDMAPAWICLFLSYPNVSFSRSSVGSSCRFLWAFGSGTISFCRQLVYEYR